MKTHPLLTRFTADERSVIDKAAEKEKRSLSSFIRVASCERAVKVLEEIQSEQ